MAFDNLSDKLSGVFKRLRSKGKLSEADVKTAMREVRLALLEADVNYLVVKDFCKKVTERCVGQQVLDSLSPAQQGMKIVSEEMTALMGSEHARLTWSSSVPTIYMLCGLQGAGKTPMAAKLAAELGVDLSMLDVQGRVMKADVLSAAGAGAPAVETTACESCESNDLPPIKVNALRRSIAANMTASWTTSPRVTYTRPVDAGAMKELRSRLKDTLKEQGIKLTFNHILMKVAAQTLMEFPDVNASFADNMLTRHRHANVGLAVAKGDGLIVPNVKSCDTKSLAQIARETEALIEATRSGKLGMEDMTGGTFTISSLGPYGITSFSPIINQPELAILGVCDMVDTPVVRNGEVVIRPMMNLSLTADHRVIDGVMAAKFLKRMAELLENPYLLLI